MKQIKITKITGWTFLFNENITRQDVHQVARLLIRHFNVFKKKKRMERLKNAIQLSSLEADPEETTKVEVPKETVNV